MDREIEVHIDWGGATGPSYFRLDKVEAKAIAKNVGDAVASWREVAAQHGLTANQIDRMASAFEHNDLAIARA
jgi:serine/threonine-protein kinase HipA